MKFLYELLLYLEYDYPGQWMCFVPNEDLILPENTSVYLGVLIYMIVAFRRLQIFYSTYLRNNTNSSC